MKETGDKVNTVDKFFKKDLFKTKNNNVWSIGGRIDGISEDKTLIEIKNRVKRLFYKLRDYEKVQVFAYMYILGLDSAKLVENIKTNTECNINVIDVAFDEVFWINEIEKKISKFIRNFEKLMASEEKKIELMSILYTSNA
jgi:hypothetical protein